MKWRVEARTPRIYYEALCTCGAATLDLKLNKIKN